ncbi:MAG: hypothetical protein HXY22_10730 [Alphaproteobacteria bacterium]|nr:hypothetical protein [Alphaproteobacteria bacterium]
MRQVHYEIALSDSARRHWRVIEVLGERSEAIARAKFLLEDGAAPSIRVTRVARDPAEETFDELTILEEMAKRVKPRASAPADSAPAALPCLAPEELFGDKARETIARLLAEPLARWKLTAFELIHRADALQRLEATGTLYQHALQKMAVAQAHSTGIPVARIVKNLNTLCLAAMHRLYRDERAGLFPALDLPALHTHAEALHPAPAGDYRLGGAIAKYLGAASDWAARHARALDACALEGEAGDAIRRGLDAYFREVAATEAIDPFLPGLDGGLGNRLLALVTILSGRGFTPLAQRLADALSAGHLPRAREAMAARLVDDLASLRRLDRDTLEGEIKSMRILASAISKLDPALIERDVIEAAFNARSRRLAAADSVYEFMAPGQGALERIERLMILSENLVGTENKRKLAGYALPLLTGHQIERQIDSLRAAPIARLQRLARLEGRILRSGIPEPERAQLVERLDEMAMKFARSSGVIESIAPRSLPPVPRALALLQFFTARAVTQGSLTQMLRTEISAMLETPGFATSYRRFCAEEADEGLASFNEALAGAGLGAHRLG